MTDTANGPIATGDQEPRVVARFSCGTASAVATKLAIRKYGERVSITYCDPGSEHSDNRRFLADCERWFGQPITVLKSKKYTDTWDVWTRERFIASQAGAPCTGALKREPGFAFERPDDILVMGYTAQERGRAASLRKQNFERVIETPLIEAGLFKADCHAIVERAGIELPLMYRLGFQNNNCIGCPKGGRGYWNMIRRHFPEAFARMAALQRDLDVAFWIEPDGTRLYLDQLDPARGVQHDEPDIECSVLCFIAETEIALGQGADLDRVVTAPSASTRSPAIDSQFHAPSSQVRSTGDVVIPQHGPDPGRLLNDVDQTLRPGVRPGRSGLAPQEPA